MTSSCDGRLLFTTCSPVFKISSSELRLKARKNLLPEDVNITTKKVTWTVINAGFIENFIPVLTVVKNCKQHEMWST